MGGEFHEHIKTLMAVDWPYITSPIVSQKGVNIPALGTQVGCGEYLQQISPPNVGWTAKLDSPLKMAKF